MVTGSSGFIGKELVSYLRALGASVINLEHESRKSALGQVNNVMKEIEASGKLDSALFHLAGMGNIQECEKHPEDAMRANVGYTEELLQLCQKVGITKIIFTSTGLVYGDQYSFPLNEDTTFTSTQTVYVKTKILAEEIIRKKSEESGFSYGITRLNNVISSLSKDGTVFHKILSSLKNKEQLLLNDLTPVRDFLYIKDAVEGLVQILLYIEKNGSRIFNLSTGYPVSINDLAETAFKIASLPLNNIKSSRRSGRSKSYLVLDNSRLVEATNWKPKYSLEEGLIDILEETL